MTHVKLCRTIDSPIGPLLLAGRDGALTNLAMDGQAHPPAGAGDWLVDNRAFADVVEQLRAYFARRLSSFEVALDAEGTDFQRQVWDALVAIPFGQTRSYGEIARAVGRPNASRAVGMANGRNPIAIVVPCHRVIGADGRLTGFGGGLHRKQALLDLEQAALREAAGERSSSSRWSTSSTSSRWAPAPAPWSSSARGASSAPQSSSAPALPGAPAR